MNSRGIIYVTSFVYTVCRNLSFPTETLKFTARFWRELHRALGTKLLMSTSFHPQTDGHSERVICSIGQILCSVVSPDQNDWVPQIPLTEFALNSSINNLSGFAPFNLNYGYMPRLTPFP